MKLTEGWHAGNHAGNVDKKMYDWKFKQRELKHIEIDKDGSEVRVYKLSKKELEKYLKDIHSRPVNRRR